MKQLNETMLGIAVALAALAGLVDAIAFLSLGGFFASFMSGNSTRLAIGAAGNWQEAGIAASLILAFLGGVIGGTLLGRRMGARRKAVTLGAVAALIALAALIAHPGDLFPALLLAMAMGAVNTLFERDGEVAVGLTYMTGTLVRLGQTLARWIDRDPDTAIDDWMRHLMLWAGFLGGGLTGVGLYWRIDLHALWLAVVTAAALGWWLWPRAKGPVRPEPDALPKVDDASSD
ncbi:YoaK family protein [Sphingomonas lacunae]|nr:YoaK family protein [Sphingomonas lacunae]